MKSESAFSLPLKHICYGERVLRRVHEYGWLPGARYTNLRTIKAFSRVGFIDINWKDYCEESHLSAVSSFRPLLTVAPDIFDVNDISCSLRRAEKLLSFSEFVIVVPKFREEERVNDLLFDERIILGYSAPTKYGATALHPSAFDGPVHILGGSPKQQRDIAQYCPTVSMDNNSITVAARFGKYFDGERQVVHPAKDVFHDQCIYSSLGSVNRMWEDYCPDVGESFLTIFEAAYLRFCEESTLTPHPSSARQ